MSVPAEATDAASVPEAVVPALSAPATPRRRAWWPWILLVLTLGMAFGWWQWQGRRTVAVDRTPDVAAQPLVAASTDAIAELRRSLDDAARVNRALREQVLGLTQRVGLVEDGLASMERGAAPGVDAVRLAEADFLLRIGEEKLQLFGDVGGAKVAFELADAQLAEVADPRATSVRQTLALERDALAAIAVADLPVLLGRLDGLADGVSQWPLRGRDDGGAGTPGDSADWWSRGANLLDRYFRVRRVDPAEQAAGGPLLRERIVLELSRARLLLLRGEGALALRAIESARDGIQSGFDASDEGVRRALAILDEVRAAPLAPTLPTLGESRRELARLRGLDAPAPVAAGADTPPPDEPAPAAGPPDAASIDAPQATDAAAGESAATPEGPATPAEAPDTDSAQEPSGPGTTPDGDPPPQG
ncbi:MAG: uroporphyrinogen-III C-methyltransferase [Xanthomonadales bacterium]|nr:hypothetical protein [Xanthomonadales bacterium]MCC6592631.1 uroporphyrinogen-III C-methyltransferase [Xanthomonadales bacterium]